MNADQFKGRWAQFKGELKKQWGNLKTMTCCKSKVIIKSFKESCRPNTATEKKR